MAKATDAEQQPAKPNETVEKNGLPMKKLLLFGIPVFVVQLVVVYFVITRVLGPDTAAASGREAARSTQGHAAESPGHGDGEPNEASIYVVKDIIVNPAGTNGTRFLLTTIGIEVTTPEAHKELEAKDVQVRDIINTILTGKDLVTLSMVDQRESVRQEIAQKIGALLHGGGLTNVYFSKFIIQ